VGVLGRREIKGADGRVILLTMYNNTVAAAAAISSNRASSMSMATSPTPQQSNGPSTATTEMAVPLTTMASTTIPVSSLTSATSAPSETALAPKNVYTLDGKTFDLLGCLTVIDGTSLEKSFGLAANVQGMSPDVCGTYFCQNAMLFGVYNTYAHSSGNVFLARY
jgi:hypothetical protein